MRITNKMITTQYQRNLNASLESLNYYNERATNYRKFNSASEDPVSASKAYALRRSHYRNSDYLTNIQNIDNQMTVAESSITQMGSLLQEAKSDIIQALNSTVEGDPDRGAIAAKLRKMQENVLAQLNSKYGDVYIFAGKDNTAPPFTLGADGALLYKGVNVDTGLHAGFAGEGANALLSGSEIDFGAANGSKLNGYTINVIEGAGTDVLNTADKVINIHLADPTRLGDFEQSLKDLLNDPANIALGFDGDAVSVSRAPSRFGTAEINGGKDIIPVDTPYVLEDLAKETNYIDIGLGLSFQGNTLNTQSVFDAALPGISFAGFGMNASGQPNNIYNLLGKIADEITKEPLDVPNASSLANALDRQTTRLLGQRTEFGAKTNFLSLTKTRMDDIDFNLNAKRKNVEMVEPSQAILDFKMQEFYYNAALQIGTKIIQNSFLDYMR